MGESSGGGGTGVVGDSIDGSGVGALDRGFGGGGGGLGLEAGGAGSLIFFEEGSLSFIGLL